jgi:hypothetical protein
MRDQLIAIHEALHEGDLFWAGDLRVAARRPPWDDTRLNIKGVAWPDKKGTSRRSGEESQTGTYASVI